MSRLLVLVLVVSWLSIGCGSPAPVVFGPGAEGHVVDARPPNTLTSWQEGPASGNALVVLTDPGELPELRLADSTGTKLPLTNTQLFGTRTSTLHAIRAEISLRT